MRQKQFEAEYSDLWQEIETMLADKAQGGEALPSRYRRLCQCLALASQRGYSPALTDYLKKLVFDCHNRLYGTAVERPMVLRAWLNHDLPSRVREEWRLLLVVLCAFWVVAAATGLLVWWKPYLAYSFVSPGELEHFHSMYLPSNANFGRGGSEGDLAMFGFYIWHNVSIDFRTFAGGFFAGIPALISVVLNGISLGVVGGWLSLDPVTRDTFWPFVVTHSSFEITGLLLSGMAGLRLGLALIHPGRMSRRHALFAAGQRMFPVIVGAGLLTFLAAFFEAFWSASPGIPPLVKYAVAAVCWLSMLLYFGFVGRKRG